MLPCAGNKVLMQLRDSKEGIIFPGHWAFFGGSINKGETPLEAAFRELDEEIGYKAVSLDKISTEPRYGYVLIHAFCFRFEGLFDALVLNEGTDLGLFSLEEVKKNVLFSKKLKKTFPVADPPYIIDTIEKALNRYREV